MAKKLITFYPTDSMEEVVKTFMARRISGAPVIDREGRLTGIISEGDCLKEVVKGKYNNMPNNSGLVKHHMSTEVYTLHPELTILEAAQQFLKLKVRRFPVIEDEKLIGLLSQSDVLLATYGLKSETWSE